MRLPPSPTHPAATPRRRTPLPPPPAAGAWHDSYDGAPASSVAWDPKELPETVRGGGRRTFPWQSAVEGLTLACAYRVRAGGREMSDFALRLAIDLPRD